MVRSEHLDQLMGALAHELGLEVLEFDEDNMCMLQGQESMSLALLMHESGQSLSLAAGIYPIHDTHRTALYQKLLKMNFLLLETQGNTLSIDEEGQEVVVCRQLELAALKPPEFIQQLLTFLISCSHLRDHLMATSLVQPDGAAPVSGAWIAG